MASSPPKTGKLNVQFYRRTLPETSIDFASEEGRTIFKEALNAGYMNCFFKLSSQFRTQDEPAYCGLTSLVMALNVLEIDPGRVWKGPWRWYTEDMLDCCVSLETVKLKGINMEQFVCIAKCNNLSVEHNCGSQFKSVEELRTLVKEKMQVDNQVVIASYSRAVLKQSGSGHFSPIAGYHEGRDLVLILDTARFKYPPHWIPLTSLLEAMKTEDPDTGLPRGLVMLTRTDDYVGTLLYRPSCSFLISSQKGTLAPQVRNFSNSWNKWLDEIRVTDEATPGRIKEFIQHFVKIVLNCLQDAMLLCLVMQSSSSSQCESLCCHMNCKNVSSEEEEQIRSMYFRLINELESLKTYEIMKEVLSSLSKEDRIQIMRIVSCSEFVCLEKKALPSKDGIKVNCSSCPNSNERMAKPNCSSRKWSISIQITPENILTILFLMWPINNRGGGFGSGKDWMNIWFKDDLKGFSKLTIRQEVLSLHVKVVEVLNYHMNDQSKAFVPIRNFV